MPTIILSKTGHYTWVGFSYHMRLNRYFNLPTGCLVPHLRRILS